MPSRVTESPNPDRRSLLAMAAMAPVLTVRATISNDIATLERIVAEDYLLVNSDSSLQDKQSYLDDFKVPGFKVDPYVVEQPVRKVWGDTALTGGLLNLGWTLDGEHHRRLLRVAHIWARQDGRWRMTYTQLTRVPE